MQGLFSDMHFSGAHPGISYSSPIHVVPKNFSQVIFHVFPLETFTFFHPCMLGHIYNTGYAQIFFFLIFSQDLTRLKVPIAYLRHMFEDALKEKTPRKMRKGQVHILPATRVSSFDQEADTAARRNDSTGR